MCSSFVRREETHAIHIMFESHKNSLFPVIVKLTKHLYTSWCTSDPLGHHVIKLSTAYFYVLSVSFRTLYQPTECFDVDFAEFSALSQK